MALETLATPQQPPRESEHDRTAVIAGGIVAAVFGYALAAAGNALADASEDTGATSATLEEAYSTLLGAMLGLAVGAAVAVVRVRRRGRLSAGLLAALLGYACLIPGLWLTSDTRDAGDLVLIVVIALPYILAAALLGAAAGMLLQRFRRV